MLEMRNTVAFLWLLLALTSEVFGFSRLWLGSNSKRQISTLLKASNSNFDISGNSRRNFLVGIGLLSSQLGILSENNFIARAEDTPDLTTQLYNPDGSLKGEIEEIKTRLVTISWGDESKDKYAINIDGTNQEGTPSGSQVRLSYQVPEKWEQKPNGYIDISTPDRVEVCEKITVYRAPGKVTKERLEKATTIGLAEALYVPDDLKVLKGADLVSGRTRRQGDTKFYDFDLAVAPKTCVDSKDNLGLGFCPFDSIYLLSAAVVDDSLYVMAVQCEKAEWKVANSDLKRIRTSFSFDEVPQ